MRRLRWTGFAGAVLAIVLAMPPMSAIASNVGSESGEIKYDGFGEFNVLSISRAALPTGDVFEFLESGAPPEEITTTGDCSPAAENPSPYLAQCPVGGVVRMTVDLRNGDDRLTVTESFPLTALGGAGDDNLAGGAGNDVLDGEGGSDVLSGGEGRDRADFSERTERLFIDLDDVNNDGASGERDNVRPDVECVIGGSDADTLIGSSPANCLDGRDGEDTIEGRGGDDVLEGGKDEAGDTLRGENGRDTLTGERGEDSLAGGEDDDTLMGGGGADELDGDRGGDSLEGGPGEDTLGGGEGDDVLYGGALGGVVGADGDDGLNGGQGVDRLHGGRGNDVLDGGPDGDAMSGESGKDTVTYDGRTNPVRVTLNGEADDGEEGEDDNVANDVEVIFGGEVDDTLFGDADANSLGGGRGEDQIDAGGGRDGLTGGKASDLLKARDGDFDVVDCEDDEDLAIADRDDMVRNCETVDRPGARHPMVGQYARVRRGKFRLQLPRGRRFFALSQDVKIPIGSTVDPKAGVRLVTARNRTARQVASVSAGRFAVRQKGRRRPVTQLQLEGRLPDCRGSSTRQGRAKRAARSSPRRLRVAVGKPVAASKTSNRAGVSVARRRGRRRGWEVLGEYSLGASIGTDWLTEDTCDGTLTTVKRGTVRVRDFGRGKTVTVRPGKPYLARAE